MYEGVGVGEYVYIMKVYVSGECGVNEGVLLTAADVPSPWLVLEFLPHGDLKSYLSVSLFIQLLSDTSLSSSSSPPPPPPPPPPPVAMWGEAS